MKKLWIIYSQKVYDSRLKRGYFDEMISRFKIINVELEVKCADKFAVSSGNSNELYYDGKIISTYPDYVIMRRFEIYLGRTFEQKFVKVINNVQSMIDTRNKMKIHQILSENGIRTPKTVYLTNHKMYENDYRTVCNIIGSNKFILKYIFGSQGSDIFLVDNEEDFNKLYRKYAGKVLFQEYIESSYGKDIRCYVIGGKFLGCVIRQNNASFKSNLAQGGIPIKFNASNKLITLAENVSKAIKCDICGVDILFDKNDTYTVCEVNSVPGFKSLKAIFNLTDIDVYVSLIESIIGE